MKSPLAHPEIEARAAICSRDVEQAYSESRCQPPTTLVDLLEIGHSHDVIWKERLTHDSLMKHFDGVAVAKPRLRILFLDIISAGDPGTEMFNRLQIYQSARLHPATAKWMHERLLVSPIFLHCITAATPVLKTGNIKFLRRDENGKGKVIGVDGFYRYSSGFRAGRAHVWFSHDITTGSSTYILDHCSAAAKALILGCASGENVEKLGRPFAVDALISEDCAEAWGEEILILREHLLRYESMRTGLNRLSPAETSGAVENLHHISQNFHIISEDITDLEERLEFLQGVHREYMGYSPDPTEMESVGESLQFLTSRTKIWKRWTMNYKDRTEIRINLFFNLATQGDSRTNLEIASFTSKIAVDTQRDSSSMITIAAVTMFFLPGTFVSALFSMVFFNSGTDQNGDTTLIVSPQWWYFIAITVPLTIVVFFVWILWQRWRNTVKGVSRSEDYGEKV